MTKNEIIEKTFRDNFIHECLSNILKISVAEFEQHMYNDMIQDIYVELLLKDDEKIIQMYERDELKFYITKLIKNNIMSKTSRYYYLYKRYLMNKDENNDIFIDEDEKE